MHLKTHLVTNLNPYFVPGNKLGFENLNIIVITPIPSSRSIQDGKVDWKSAIRQLK